MTNKTTFDPEAHRRALEVQKRLVELKGWNGLPLVIGVPALSADGIEKVCIAAPEGARAFRPGALLEAKIPDWINNWSDFGELIHEHRIQVSPGAIAVIAKSSADDGYIDPVIERYSNHPNELSAIRLAAAKAAVAILEAELNAQRSPVKSSTPGPSI